MKLENILLITSLFLSACSNKLITLDKIIKDQGNNLSIYLPNDWQDFTQTRINDINESIKNQKINQEKIGNRFLLEFRYQPKDYRGKNVGISGCILWSMPIMDNEIPLNHAKKAIENSVSRFQSFQNRDIVDNLNKGLSINPLLPKTDKYEISPIQSSEIGGFQGWEMKGKLFAEGVLVIRNTAYAVPFFEKSSKSHRILFIDCSTSGWINNSEETINHIIKSINFN